MVKTYGLTHIALAMKDAKRSFEFYRKVFGVITIYDQGGWIQAQTPGSRDIIVFDESAPRIGKPVGSRISDFACSNQKISVPQPTPLRKPAERFWTKASSVPANLIYFSKI